MQINITGHHVDVTPSLRDYVNSKFEKLKSKFSNITNIHVILTLENKFQQKAEANVDLARGKINATSQSDDMYAAIDMLIEKVDKQVVKHKEKLSQHGDGESLI